MKNFCPGLTNSVFGYIGATHADLMEAVQSFVWMFIGIHGRGLAQLCMHKSGKPIRIMILPPISQNLFMHIPQVILL